MGKYVAPVDATELVLESGKVLVPGEPFDLTAEEKKDAHTKRLLDEGHIVELKEAKS